MTVAGAIGQNAVVKDFNGRACINFSVAHSEKYVDAQGQQQQSTTWVSCEYWRDAGKTGIAPYLLKGTKVVVMGKPSVNTYTKNNGETASTLKLRVSDLHLMSTAEQGASDAPQQTAPRGATQTPGYAQTVPGAQDAYYAQLAQLDTQQYDDLPF